MRALKILILVLGGAIMMVSLLMWVAQFFTGNRESKPVIWIEQLGEQAEGESQDFAEFEDDGAE